MALNRGGQRPEVHAVGADADGPAPAAGAERQDLVKAVEQADPLPFADQPLQLGPVGREVRLDEPPAQMPERLLLEGGVGFDALEPLPCVTERVHAEKPCP